MNTAQAEEEIVLPHVRWSADELERRHPSQSVPEDEGLDDGHEREADRADATLQRGLRIARSIREEMSKVGRTKHMTDEPSHCDTTPRPRRP